MPLWKLMFPVLEFYFSLGECFGKCLINHELCMRFWPLRNCKPVFFMSLCLFSYPFMQLYDFGFQDPLPKKSWCPWQKTTVPVPRPESLACHKTVQPVVGNRSPSWVLPPPEKKACPILPGRSSKTACHPPCFLPRVACGTLYWPL